VTGAGNNAGNNNAGPPLVVAHLSDLHLGAHDPAAAETLAADVEGASPDLTVVTGDLTMRARRREFAAARRLLNRLPRPILVVTGNHDLPLVSPARLFTPYALYRTWIEDDLDPVVRIPGLTALGLQSMPRWRWKSGRISARQTGAVERVFDREPALGVRLLALHHPPFATGPSGVAGRERLIQALFSARVDVVLAGHTHVPYARGRDLHQAGRVRHLVEVVAGTAISRRTRGGAGRSWNLLRIGPTAVVVEQRRHGAQGWYRELDIVLPVPPPNR
jgi:3',5'-cyclic AMP phosphodiesterase CpdA